MNKREFVTGGVAAVVATPVLARSDGGVAAQATLQGLLTRTRRLPDLIAQAGADAFDAYVGERFDVVGGVGTGERLVVRGVERVGRCAATEQFNVAFEAVGASPAVDGVRLLLHGTGQRLALHLEPATGGYTARFNLLT